MRVTTIDPGTVATEFSLVRFDDDKEKARATYEGMAPLQPEDVADGPGEHAGCKGGGFPPGSPPPP